MRTPVEYEIQSLTFDDGGLSVVFARSTDVRVGGKAFLQSQLSLSAAHPDYGDDIEQLHDRAVRVLKNAMEDFEESPPYVPTEEPDEDDSKGMGE